MSMMMTMKIYPMKLKYMVLEVYLLVNMAILIILCRRQ